ncbi:MAG: exo-alpha-sialidase, partial [Burkholderiales bacterium]|nr:exo-alpha-sialidase [Burkholderiales bacterium]
GNGVRPHFLIRAVVLAAFAAPALAAFPPLPPYTVVEYYHAGFDHYFITSSAEEIDALDSGRTRGWSRTGRAFEAVSAYFPGLEPNPVCRFHIPPQHGDSHFFSASPAECAAIRAKIGVDPNYSGYIEETPNAFQMYLPSQATGACWGSPVYRLWNQRADSNHRYTTDAGTKAAMQAKGYAAEGYGPDAVAMCTRRALLVDARVAASGMSAFTPGCDGVPEIGTVHVNAEVEPFIAVNPANPNNLIAVWQQDRWSNGGARGPGVAYSLDGGGTWTRTSTPMSRCAGGTGANAFERASDPWVTFAPDGTAYQAALGFNNQADVDNAILVSRSTDGGRTWSEAIAVRRDGAQGFNDKEAITADPTDARYVYVTWDRLTGNHGPTWLARTVDGGTTWEPARPIYDPGATSQTLNNIVVVLADGTLVLFFTELANVGPQNARLRIMRSADKGATWSMPITIAGLQTVGTVDPETGTGIRDGSGLGAVAAGPGNRLAVAWQDARFNGGAFDAIAYAHSPDGGLTWSAPTRINGDPAVRALIPSIAFASDGTVGVAYYDFRSNTPDAATLLGDYWLATSPDGVAWSERLIEGSIDYARAPLAGGRYFLGDYMGLATIGATFVPLYGRTTADPSNRSDMIEGLARPLPGMPAARRVVTTADPGVPMSAAFAARVEAAIRTAVRERRVRFDFRFAGEAAPPPP